MEITEEELRTIADSLAKRGKEGIEIDGKTLKIIQERVAVGEDVEMVCAEMYVNGEIKIINA